MSENRNLRHLSLITNIYLVASGYSDIRDVASPLFIAESQNKRKLFKTQ